MLYFTIIIIYFTKCIHSALKPFLKGFLLLFLKKVEKPICSQEVSYAKVLSFN